MANPFGAIIDGITGALTSQRATTEMDRFRQIFMGENAPNSSGISVNTRTVMGIAAYYACVRNISEDCAKMPIRLAKTRADGGADFITKHPILPLLNRQPNPSMSAMSFRESVFAQALTCESSFAEIVRDGAGRVTALWPLDSSRMSYQMNDDTGLIDYEYHMENGRPFPLRARDVFHIHGVGGNGVSAWVNTKIGQVTFGRILAQQLHAAGFFGNNAILAGVLEAPATLSPKALENLRASFSMRHGGPDKAYKWAVLPDGIKAHPLATDPEKSQLIEAIYQGVEETCRYFRCPPNKIQHLLRSTYSNISEENQSYATDCLQPWTERFSQEVQIKILGANEQDIEVYFDDRMFLESDPVKRTDVQMKQFQMGLYSIDELRIEAGLKPIGGDVGTARWVMSNVQAAEKAIAPEPEKQSAPALPAPEPEEDEQPEPQEPERATLAAAFRIVFAGHFARMIRVSEQRAQTASKKGKLTEFQAEYRKNTLDFVREGVHEAVTGMAVAHGKNLNGKADTLLDKIAGRYLELSGERLIAVCAAKHTDDAQAWAERMADYAISACMEVMGNGKR